MRIEEGGVGDGRRDAVDDAQLARVAVREDGLARVHRHGSLARLLRAHLWGDAISGPLVISNPLARLPRAHRVAKRDAACEGVVDVT